MKSKVVESLGWLTGSDVEREYLYFELQNQEGVDVLTLQFTDDGVLEVYFGEGLANMHFELQTFQKLIAEGVEMAEQDREAQDRNRDTWPTDYQGIPIQSAIPIGGGRCVILLDGHAIQRRPSNNLLCIKRSGAVVWIAKPPYSTDFFVSLNRTSEGLFSHAVSGYLLRLDEDTGATLETTFTK